MELTSIEVCNETSAGRNTGVIKISGLSFVQERFYRAEYSNFANGTGLGLSRSKEIVEKFNGQLIMESEIGVGASVSLLLPFA